MDNLLFYPDQQQSDYGYLEIFTFLKILSPIKNLEFSLEVEVKGENKLEQEKIFNKDKKSVEYSKSVSQDNQVISYPFKILRVYEQKQMTTFTVFEGSKNSLTKKVFGSASSLVKNFCKLASRKLDILNQDGIIVAEMQIKTIEISDLKKSDISFQLRANFEFSQIYSIQTAFIVLMGKSNIQKNEEIEVYQGEVGTIQSKNSLLTLAHQLQNIQTQHLFSKLLNKEQENSEFKVKLILREVKQQGSNQQQDEFCFVVKKADIKSNKMIEIQEKQLVLEDPSIQKSFSLKTFKCSLQKINLQEQITFNDYVKNGINFNLIMGIDFSESNGDPTQPTSLHNTSPEYFKKNPYVQAIHVAGNFLMKYDSDKEVPVYGFSGIPQLPHCKLNAKHDCFPIIGYKHYPELTNVSGILSGYFNIIDNNYVKFGGKTQIKPLLENVYRKATQGKNESERNYYILLIITDGVCHDLGEAIEQIKLCADLPLSIIIVGVGDEDFEDMDYLNNSIEGARDIVSFVKMSDFQEGKEQDFYSKIFYEVPQQVHN